MKRHVLEHRLAACGRGRVPELGLEPARLHQVAPLRAGPVEREVELQAQSRPELVFPLVEERRCGLEVLVGDRPRYRSRELDRRGSRLLSHLARPVQVLDRLRPTILPEQDPAHREMSPGLTQG